MDNFDFHVEDVLEVLKRYKAGDRCQDAMDFMDELEEKIYRIAGDCPADSTGKDWPKYMRLQ